MNTETLWMARYRLPDGRWQHWAGFQNFQEAVDAMKFHAQGRDFEILTYTSYTALQSVEEKIHEAITLMEKTKGAFRSKLIALARAEAEKAREIMEEIL